MKKFFVVVFVLCGAVLLASGCSMRNGYSNPMADIDIPEGSYSNGAGYTIEKLDDTSCAITGVYLTDSILDVPASIDGLAVTKIGQYAFNDLPAVEINLPDTVTDVAMCAIANCNNLTTIRFGSCLKTFGVFGVTSCPSLTELVFPVGFTTFEGCPISGDMGSLKVIDVPESVDVVPSDFALIKGHYDLKIVAQEGTGMAKFADDMGLPLEIK